MPDMNESISYNKGGVCGVPEAIAKGIREETIVGAAIPLVIRHKLFTVLKSNKVRMR